MSSTIKEEQLSFLMPRSLGTRIHMKLVIKPTIILMYLTASAADENPVTVPMGTLVYSLPDRFNPETPLSTVVYKYEPTLDFTTRLAKFLVKKTNMHFYVSSSANMAEAGLGSTAEEEMEIFKKVFEVALCKIQSAIQPSAQPAVNGTTSST